MNWKNISSLSWALNIYWVFNGSYQFLSFSLDSLFKNLGEDNFKYLSQEFDNNVSDLVK